MNKSKEISKMQIIVIQSWKDSSLVS